MKTDIHFSVMGLKVSQGSAVSHLNLAGLRWTDLTWLQASGQVQVCSMGLPFRVPGGRNNGYLGFPVLMEDGRSTRQRVNIHNAS